MLTIDNLTDMLCQIIQQFKLTVRQIDIFAALGNRVGIRMNRQIANLNIGILGFGCWRCGSFLTAQVGLDSCYQLTVGKWLGNIVIGPQLQS